jgi:hypothetical protein
LPPITQIPGKSDSAQFRPGFGRRFILTVDTEEEFDWSRPIRRDGYSLGHVPWIEKFQQFCEKHQVCPIYLIDYPIATSPEAIAILKGAVAAGKAEIGIQLHPWVNPPFDEEVNEHNSFAGNLPRALEAAKLTRLRDTITQNFGTEPLIYRAGRYGAGPNTAEILADAGIAVDTSVRAKFDYSSLGGADYRQHPLSPYWLDERRRVLELPLTTVFWGMLRRQGDLIYPALWRAPRLRGLLARFALLERISMTPEGIDVDEAIRGIDIALDDGLPLLVFSFHSPSLQPGLTPYVRSAADLDRFYDWWRRIFTYLEQCEVTPASLRDVMDGVMR